MRLSEQLGFWFEMLKFIADDKRKTRENLGSLCKKMGDLANWDMEKLEALNDFFCLGLFPQDFKSYEL